MNPACALLGIGHIGGSIALGLRAAGAARVIHGYDADAETLQQGREQELIDVAHPTPEAAIEDAELIVLAVPPSAIAELCQRLQPHITGAQVVTDVGSIKQPVLRQVEQACGQVPSWFVPGHPIAGTEKSGPQHAAPELFRDRRVVLTPTDDTDPEKIGQVRAMWEQLGAQVDCMDAQAHDALFAGISHLPHVLAYVLMEVLTHRFSTEQLQRYAAGGLLDFTRIASSNPELWLDICRANQAQLAPILDQVEGRLRELTAALREGREDELRSAFTTAKQTRDTLRPKPHE